MWLNNYLEHRLLSASFLGDKEKGIEEVFEAVKNAYEKCKALNLGPGKEASLEDKFVRPVLKLLGFEYDVQPITLRGVKKKRPDYALFKDYTSLEEACKEKDNPRRFFSYPLTILEAKYWGRRLNDADPNDTLDRRDPTAQTVKYLDDVYYATEGRIQWAMLTNGKQWRLFYYRAASRSGNFYEVDLEEIIQSKNLDNFKYFYLFFAKDAFVPESTTGKTWLDQHLKGSEDYATRVSENLKNLIFESIFECLATGFIEYRRVELGIKKETDETLREVFNGCLTLLYRLLFLLYAESRALLPVNDRDRYYKKSLKKLKEDIARDSETTGIENMSHNSYDYWSRLESLCRIIDKGDKVLNIPIYNGGLFETQPGSFLTTNKMPDPFVAQAIDLLTIDQEGEYTPGQKPFIDYSSLSVRHLGDIYEGLLEFHVRIADEPMVEVKEKGKFFWKKESEIEAGIRTCSKNEKGDVYIENSKHERKATGSYYTPHYIVEYIVKNTIEPVLKARIQKAEEILSELEALYEKQWKQLKKPKDWKHWEHSGEPKGSHIDEIVKLEKDLFETVFDIKALDPAMGSGHFLVHAVDFITDRIITFLTDFPENPVIRRINEMKGEILEEVARQGVKIDETKLTEVNLIKRTVMKRCIYGVDLNEMAVELAKLSLWLDSFTLGAPLSFLDHHLKCGNSLIGTDLESLENATKSTLIKVNIEPLDRAIKNMLFVSSLSDATYQQVKDSEQKYRDADKNIVGYRILMDILVAEFFGIDFGKGRYKELLLTNCSKMDFDKAEKSINLMNKFDKEKVLSVRTIAREKRFFHWDIEFPEVFFERVGALEQKVERKENPGFDCVIGNPPYINVEEIAVDDRAFLMEAGIYKTPMKRMDIFVPFHEQSINLLKNRGMHSFIVPFPLLTQDYGQKLRVFFLDNTIIRSIADLSQWKIFPDAMVRNIIPVFEKQRGVTDYKIQIINQVKDPNEIQEVCGIVKSINARQFRYTYENMFRIDLSPEPYFIQSKIDKASNKFGKIFAASWGARGVPVEKFHLDTPINRHCKKMIKGNNIDRYELEYSDKWLLYDPEILYRPSMTAFFDNAKIVFQKVTGNHGLIGTFDDNGFYTDDSLICCIPKHLFEEFNERILRRHKIFISLEEVNLSRKYNFLYVLAVMNSVVNGFYFKNFVGYDLNAYPENIEYLPIPNISFTTTEKERKDAIERFKSYYLPLSSKYDNIIASVETCLPEKSDVVHDLLAYLAEQMIETNKRKNEETKGFLKWLEREIGSEIDNLANKTAIKEYHETDFNQLLEVIKKNRNKVSIDPSDRKTQELLENQFTKSMSILEPLKARIKATDELIDEIVYRLYGLTEEEIKVVKGGTT